MGCQKAIVEKIMEKKADYVIALKENQGELFQQVKDYLKKDKPHLPYCQQLNKDHNRREKRVVYVAKKGHYVDAADAWKNLISFVLVESTRIVNKKETTYQRIYISSLTDECPEKYARLIRGHWGIENGLHWHSVWVQPKLSLRGLGWVEGFNVLAYQRPAVTHCADAEGQDPLCAVDAPALARALQAPLHHRAVGGLDGPRAHQQPAFAVRFVIHPVAV